MLFFDTLFATPWLLFTAIALSSLCIGSFLNVVIHRLPRRLESEWRSWMADGGLDAPKNPDKAFLGFCRKWYERRGPA